MGLWAQNVGVNAPSLPPAVLARAGSELFGVPEEMEGWTWTTLDDKSFLDLGELDALLADTAKEAGAPALAFSVHDSDSVYLAGADASGLRFRLVVNPEAWEDQLPRRTTSPRFSPAGSSLVRKASTSCWRGWASFLPGPARASRSWTMR
jgi:hypothetical protein